MRPREQEEAMHTDDAKVKKRFATAGWPKAGALLNWKILAASVSVGLLILTGCGGAYQYQNARPPNQPPYQKSLAQVQVNAIAGPSIQISGTVVLSASAVYQ